jgi:hypothetical protein
MRIPIDLSKLNVVTTQGGTDMAPSTRNLSEAERRALLERLDNEQQSRYGVASVTTERNDTPYESTAQSVDRERQIEAQRQANAHNEAVAEEERKAALAADQAREQREKAQRERQKLLDAEHYTVGNHIGLICYGVLAVVFGFGGWLLGSSLSVDGWFRGVTMFGEWVKIPITLSPLRGDPRWIALMASGILYSFAEVKVKRPKYMHWKKLIALWIAYLLIHGTDWGSTFIAIAFPAAENTSTIALWFGHYPLAALIPSFLLTYLPEIMIMAGVSWIVVSTVTLFTMIFRPRK